MLNRLGGIAGSLCLCALFAIPCVALSRGWLSDTPLGRLCHVVVWLTAVPLLVALGLTFLVSTIREAFSVQWTFESDAPRIKGSAITAFGTLYEARAVADEVERACAFRGAPLSSAEAFHADLRTVRKALCNRGNPRVQWRNADVLLFAALSGMIARDELRITLQGRQWWTRKGADLKRGEGTAANVMVRAATAQPPDEWLERRIFDALPPVTREAVESTETPAQGPFRTAARVESAPSEPRALDACLTEALTGLPELQRTLIDRVRDDRAMRASLDATTAITMLLSSLTSEPETAGLLLIAIAQSVRRIERGGS